MQADATILYDPVIDRKKFAVTVQHRSETLILIYLLPVQRSSRVFHHHVSRLLYNLIHSLRDFTAGRKNRIKNKMDLRGSLLTGSILGRGILVAEQTVRRLVLLDSGEPTQGI